MDLTMIIIKKLAEEFQKLFTCLGENIEKYITISVLIQKEFTRIYKDDKKFTKIISYRLQFNDSARFVASTLSSFGNTLAEGIDKIKCKYKHDGKKCETGVSKYKYCNCFFEYTNFKEV